MPQALTWNLTSQEPIVAPLAGRVKSATGPCTPYPLPLDKLGFVVYNDYRLVLLTGKVRA